MVNKIVIGAGFGDCGKGVAVDNLCNNTSLVVRFSGGQQAGHTVIRDGIKHVFSSYGAGTLRGRPTFFTEDTTFYLPNILVEKNILAEKGIVDPKLYLHPLAMATTPYDVAYNHAREISLGHGSCGLGVGATMARTLKTGHKLFAIDFTNKDILKAKLNCIYQYYANLIDKEFPAFNSIERHEFRVSCLSQEKRFWSAMDGELPFLINKFEDIKRFYGNFIFEGSQGILLDMDHGIFPNVTYANTTCKNALKYCSHPSDTEIYYTARCYLTRHGAGWMPDSKEPELINNEEEINVLNKYQGNFRRGQFDYDLLNYSIAVDGIYFKGIKKNLIVSCVDQIPDFVLDKGRINGVDSFYTNSSAKCGNLKEIE